MLRAAAVRVRAEKLNKRLPQPSLDAVMARARARGIPYTRFAREALESAQQEG